MWNWIIILLISFINFLDVVYFLKTLKLTLILNFLRKVVQNLVNFNFIFYMIVIIKIINLHLRVKTKRQFMVSFTKFVIFKFYLYLTLKSVMINFNYFL